jgi:hypothetical protein
LLTSLPTQLVRAIPSFRDMHIVDSQRMPSSVPPVLIAIVIYLASNLLLSKGTLSHPHHQ